jgi:Arc/MetJ-type ribon-helix-helix transcriptional regulator
MRDEQLTITLSDEETKFVREQVEHRGEVSPHDVVKDALSLLRKRESDVARLRAALDEAAADPRRYSMEEVEAHLEELFARYEHQQ